ncbi:rhomboid family intramembrane serine protease [Aggregicoccus sp. 17bor-14]|uniref:rhomboid family intramembrane serine protease n=1 Tax=Myxococcaceae TaxID=31 RepID=UPI003519F6A4
MRGGGFGGFGGGVGLDTMAAKLAVGLVVGSVLVALTHGAAGDLLILRPASFLYGLRLWQPLTYAFVETSPLGVIFGVLITWSIGGALEMSLGSRRLFILAVGCTALAGLLTVAVALLFTPLLGVPFPGGTVMTSVLWVGYGLYIGRGQANFWGLPMTGNGLAAVGVGFVVLNAAFSSIWLVLPDLFGMALAFLYVRGGSPRTLWLRFNHKRLQRRLTGRPKHLRVVNRNKPDRDQYLN